MVTIKGEEVGTLGTMPVCEICGSERVVHDAWACWNRDYAIWELENVFDQMYCRQCEAETRFTWRRVDTGPCIAVRDLNDRFRKQGLGNGSVMITAGLQECGEAFIRKAVDAVRAFDAFTEANDPWGEHDFGAIEIDGEKVFWKIDAYDPSLTTGSENPANEAKTHRVLTIMLAREY